MPATRLRIVLVTYMLLFIIMEGAKPVMSKKGEKKKTKARVNVLEKKVEEMKNLLKCKRQTKLLTKAVNELKAPVQPGKLTAPITTTSLAKDQGLDELLKKLDNGGGLDALVSCGDLDDLPPSFDSTIPPAGQAQGDTTRVDLNPHVYLGKSNAGKEEKPLLIPGFVDVYSGSNEPEEQELGSSGGAQVIVRAFKKKTPALDTITLSQSMGASVKILNVLLERQNMNVRAIQDYLAYIVKVSELIEEHTWQSVILYDNEYRKLQHRHGFRWGSDSQHLHTRFLKKRQGSSFSNTTPPAGARANKSSTDQPSVKTEETVEMRGTLKLTKNVQRRVPATPSGRTVICGMRGKQQNNRLVMSATAKFASK
ncbi:hypothetical protein ACROYT_G022817 [Oculina patagonica]